MRPRIAYQPGTSLLHRLHPLVKGAWLVVATLFVFIIRSPWAVLAVLAAAVLAVPLCGLRWQGLRGTRLLVTTALFLAVLQLVFIHAGPVLLAADPVVITWGGLEAAVYVAGRFASVVLLSYLFVLTTEPNHLAHALMRAGLPYRYGFALITALRLVPLFEQQGQTVYNAQLARGVQYDARHSLSPRRLLALARQFFMPLLVTALGHVDALAVSMEGRCFGKYLTRTWLHEVTVSRRDVLAALLLLLVAVGVGILSL